MGANSETVLGSTLVPEERNPTEFSIDDMPGMFIWARNEWTFSRKIPAIIEHDR
jgi:hypothetical protein